VVPETRYAKSGDINVAYQVVGNGPDLLYGSGWVSNVEMMWELPIQARFLTRLASFARLITFDKRGTGLSDRVPPERMPTLEERTDDIRAVLDAAGSDRAFIFGVSEAGSMSILFAATHPDRTAGLITFGAFAKRIRAHDYPWAPPLEERLKWVESVERDWARSSDIGTLAPTLRNDKQLLEWWSAYRRRSASPGGARALALLNTYIDLRAVLPAVAVPTLIINRRGDADCDIGNARYLAARIPGARLVELDGEDHLPWVGDSEAVLAEIEEFVTGSRPLPEADRFLATVMFTDIVDSTRTAAGLGDHAWRDLVERHHDLVRRELRRHRGEEQDTAGDGFFATFDGPARAVRCALAIRDAVGGLGLQIRAGVHTGELERIAGKAGGIAAIVGARIRELAEPGDVLVSSTVRDLVSGSGLRFADRGVHALKGVPDPWHVFVAS
jgi:pimeloyl-ACP methyl ester carboxylesterase